LAPTVVVTLGTKGGKRKREEGRNSRPRSEKNKKKRKGPLLYRSYLFLPIRARRGGGKGKEKTDTPDLSKRGRKGREGELFICNTFFL